VTELTRNELGIYTEYLLLTHSISSAPLNSFTLKLTQNLAISKF